MAERGTELAIAIHEDIAFTIEETILAAVNVVAANTPPVITSTPLLAAQATVLYQYAVTAQDPDHDTLSFSLTTYPGNMTINSSTGVISWTPAQQMHMPYTVSVTVQVSEGQGNTATQSFTITVSGASANQTPTITSSPRTQMEIGLVYLYQVVASDADNDALTYSLTTNPSGMTISTGGLVSWTPTASQAGNNNVSVQVSDGRGASITQSFTIAVGDFLVNHPPVITSVPPLTATVGQLYAYNLQGYDPDGDPLAWSLTAAPAGMSIDPNLGYLRWTPAGTQVGSQNVTVRVVDDFGASATQSYIITDRGGNLPPLITSQPPLAVQTGTLYYYAIAASDADGDPQPRRPGRSSAWSATRIPGNRWPELRSGATASPSAPSPRASTWLRP